MKKMRMLTWAAVAMMTAFVACENVPDDENLPTGPGENIENDGSFEKPYSVADVIKFNPQSSDQPVQQAVWAEGYIVGVRDYTVEPATDDFNAEDGFKEVANVYIAAESNVTDYKSCVSVQLVAELRAKLNLLDNPDNHGAKLKLQGDILRYNSVPGLKNMIAYSLDGGEVVEKPKPVVDEVEVCGDLLEAKTSYAINFDDLVHDADFASEGWKNLTIQGDRKFRATTHSAGEVEQKYIQATAHGGKAEDYELWVISPGFNLDAASHKTFSVDIAKVYTKETTTFKAYVLQCVNGETVRTPITVPMPGASEADHTFFPSGNIDLSAFTGVVYIGFEYIAKGGMQNSTTWRLDNFEFGTKEEAATTIEITATDIALEVGKTLDYALTAKVLNGKGETTIAAAGVPAWATFVDNGDGTATLKGTAPATPEEANITLTASNNGVEVTKTITLSVYNPTMAHSAYFSEFNDAQDKTDYVSDGWFTTIVSGDRNWQGKTHSGNGYVQATAHGGSASRYVSEFTSPLLDLDQATAKVLSFKMAQAYWKDDTKMNIYIQKESDKSRTELTGMDLPVAATENYVFVESGDIDLSAHAGQVRIIFRYDAAGGQSASTTWCVDDFRFGPAAE